MIHYDQIPANVKTGVERVPSWTVDWSQYGNGSCSINKTIECVVNIQKRRDGYRCYGELRDRVYTVVRIEQCIPSKKSTTHGITVKGGTLKNPTSRWL